LSAVLVDVQIQLVHRVTGNMKVFLR
jgi:hypothetical protein